MLSTIFMFLTGYICSNEGYSQYGQDIFVHENYFREQKTGFFIDIGAHDGLDLNNTYLFEKKGWKGICIEPNPDIYNRLRRNRNCFTIEGCVSNREGEAKFCLLEGYTEMLSGLVDKYDREHAKRIESELNHYGGNRSIITVQTFMLNNILKEHGVSEVDYLSLDTEGGELEILKSIDFDSYSIKVIDVEDNYTNSGITEFLVSKGYRFVKTLGCDKIFVKLSNSSG